jgi:hypothetical protein
MTLRFYARHDHRVLYPGLKTSNGQPPMYLGRAFIRGEVDEKGNPVPGKPPSAPATQAPIECELGSEVANRIMRLMIVDAIDPPFFCADEATANATGLPYVKADFSDGVWSERPQAQLPEPEPTDSE